MQALTHLADAKQHDPEEARLQKERGHDLIAHQRSDYRPRLGGKYRPVGAELIRQHHAGYHAHTEADGKNLEPVAVEVRIDATLGFQPQAFKHHQVTREPDGKRGEYKMERHSERELYARE